MASILIVSKQPESIALADYFKTKNHLVRIWNKDFADSKTQNPRRIHEWKVFSDASDLVIFDSPGFGEYGDSLAAAGRLVIGSGRLMDSLANQDFANRTVKTLFGKSISNSEETIAIEGWFNGDEFINLCTLQHLYPRLMEGDKGEVTTGTGYVLKFYNSDIKIFKESLEKFTPMLKIVKYVGPLRLGLNITPDEVSIASITPHFNIDSLCTMTEGLVEDLFDFLLNITLKKTEFKANTAYNMGVKLTNPPWPYNSSNGTYPTKDLKNKHAWQTCESNSVALMTAYGDTTRECRRRINRSIDNYMPSKDLQYRTDIGAHCEGRFANYQKWGWLSGA